MGRRKGEGKNGGASAAPKQTAEKLSEDQIYSLTEQHRKRYETLLAGKKTADTALRNFCKIIKADLGSEGLQDIKDLIVMSTPEGEASVKAKMERQARIMRWMNIPIGTQGALFGEPDRTPLKERAFNDGKRQGLAGETQSNPHHQSTEAYHAHNEGYEAGQDQLRKGFGRLDNTPKGSVPRDEWQKNIAEQNQQTEDEIKQTAAELKASANLGSSRPTYQMQ